MFLRNNVALRVAIALAIPLISMEGHAANHWYVGAKAGWIKGGSACEEHATACDSDTTGGGIFVGYQANDWLALEGGYDYLGEITADYPALGNPDVSAPYKGKMQGLEFVAKPFWRVTDEVTWFAKVGTLAWNMDVTGQEVGFEHRADDNGWSPLLGTGVEYAFNRNWSALLEYQWVNNVGGESTGGMDLHMVNLGVAYHFASEEVAHPAPVPAPTAVTTMHQEPQWSFHGGAFVSGSSQLTPELQQALQPVIQRLREHPQSTVVIKAHTDSIGSFDANQRLSEQRANAVQDYLLRQGVAATQVSAVGYGETQPVADNMYEAGRYQNRRVDVLSPEFEMTAGPAVGKKQ